MSILQNWRRMGVGLVVPPLGIIMGTTSVVPVNWALFSAADGLFLRGTDADATAGTTGSRSALTTSTGSGGAHATGTYQVVSDMGQNDYTGSQEANPTRDAANAGSHTAHAVTANYRPASNKLKLVQAGVDAEFATGLIGFSTTDMPDQTPFSTFNGGTGLLEGETATGTTVLTKSLNNTGSQSGYHDHLRTYTGASYVAEADQYTTVSSSGGSHVHAGNAAPTLSHSAATVLLRAWEIADIESLGGLIGMYIGAGVPDKWEIVSECVGQYVKCDAAGDGAQSGGANTVTFSGTVSNVSHSHSFSGLDTGLDQFAYIHHSNLKSHNHAYNSIKTYEPERYHIKFIRYMG